MHIPLEASLPGGAFLFTKEDLVLLLPQSVGLSQTEKTSHFRRRFFVLALPIFPASHPASIVGANELNFCVRDGNRWTLAAINTNSVVASMPLYVKDFRL